MTPERVLQYQAKGAGFTLSYATELVSDEILEFLFGLAKEREIVKWMHRMQAGEVVNLSENRAALHTAMRLKKGAKHLSTAALQAAELAWGQLDALSDFLPTVSGYTDIVQVGIGGSSLGPEAIYHALKAYAIPGRKAHFIANIDPDQTAAVLQSVNLAKTLFVIVSKSGSTLETVTSEAIIRSALIKAGLDPTLHLIGVTGKGSPMDEKTRYRALFYIWDFVGGRFSVTSMVGAVVLAFTLGIETFFHFLDGAYAMDGVALKDSLQDNLPLLGALIGVWNRSFLGLDTVAVVPYAEALARFPAHLQQLDMESNGKGSDRQDSKVTYPTGPILFGEPGTSCQHSFFQLIHQGTTPVPLELIGFTTSQRGYDLKVNGTTSQQKLVGNMLAQSLALALGKPEGGFPGNRPSQLLIGQRCDAHTLGALLAYYEHKVAFQGFFWNINSFDQPGVELGKHLATRMIGALAGSQVAPLEEAFARLLGSASSTR